MVVEGEDANYRSLTVGKLLLREIRKHLDLGAVKNDSSAIAPLLPPIDNLQLLDTLKLDKDYSKKDYEAELEKLQGRLNLLTRLLILTNTVLLPCLKAMMPQAKAAVFVALPPR